MVKCENYLRYFKKYTDEFFTEVSLEDRFKIELKIVHTMHVLKLMRKLAKEEGLQNEDYEIAKVIALFHDFGRFNQVKIYGTFNDSKSVNHAEESVREMQRLNVLDKASDTYVPEYKKELIYKAILNHNRDEIIGENDEKLIKMSKLIRDTDKIDIYRTTAKYLLEQSYDEVVKTLNLDPSFEITKETYDKVMKGIKLKKSDINTVADNFIWNFYWIISDMNYPASLKIVKEKGYLENLKQKLIDTGKLKYEGDVKEALDYIMNEFYNRVEKGTL